ncbi:MAG: CBS domain-containing protein [Desulfarculaceae bacterium]|nr:CBS domain-containing protein [Desulfarculaceae bacterium]
MNFSQLDEYIHSLTNDDIIHAMKEIPGYLDITPSDFMLVYRAAFEHALNRLKTAIRAEHVMTGKVVSVFKNAKLSEIAEKLADHDISGLPVVEEDFTVVGVISEKDFLKRMNKDNEVSFMRVILQCMESRGCAASDLKTKNASDMMSFPPVTVLKETPVLEVANTMDQYNINRVPVVDEQNILIGIIARSDLVQAMC